MARHVENIYVQIDIHGPLDRLWDLTQTPELHQQWDLRFTDIQYLPRPDLSQPQRFLYATRIGFGLKIRGEGESVGSRNAADGARTSALKFWSDDPKSLIRTGSGFWKYVPCAGDRPFIRFLTEYDYTVRFGLAGRLFDRAAFRPLIGWATAWSFDRLRLWIERDIPPAVTLRQSLIHLLSRLSVAGIWLYEGLVPKLIFRHPDELAMLRDLGVSHGRGPCIAIGAAEVALGLILILFWKSRWPLLFTLIAMPIATIVVAVGSPRFFQAPFSPATLNLATFVLAAIAWWSAQDIPTARHCVRRPERRKS